MPYADSSGTSIYYEVHGDGPPVVLVHGSGGNHAAWWQQIAGLQKRFTVVTIDLRGFGKSQSDSDAYEEKDFAGDIVAVLDAADLNDAILLGQSIGAAAALRAGLRSPARVIGVILSNSVGGLKDEGLAALVRADRAKAEKLPVLDRLMSKKYLETQPALVLLFRQMGTFNAASMQGIRQLTNEGPTAKDVLDSGIGVAFLAGERDAVMSPATVTVAHKLLPGSILKVVDDAPHSMYWESADIYNAAIEWLADQLIAKKRR